MNGEGIAHGILRAHRELGQGLQMRFQGVHHELGQGLDMGLSVLVVIWTGITDWIIRACR